MRFPGAFRDLHVGKHRCKAGILRAAGVDAEANPPAAFPHMANPHLAEMFAILRAFDAVIIFSAAQSIPHGLHIRGDRRGRPVGIAVVGDH